MITLSVAVDMFLLARRAEGKAKSTLKWYTSMMSIFLGFIGDVPLDAIDANAIRRYLAGVRERDTRYPGLAREVKGKLSADTLRGYDRAVRTLFNFLAREELLDKNPMLKIKKPPIGEMVPKAMPIEDFRRLLDACPDTQFGRRDRAILYFLLDTGCRAGGLVGLTDERLDLVQRSAIVNEKGNRDHMKFFKEETAQVLLYWLEVRPETAMTVFCALSGACYGKPLTIEGLHEVLKRLARKAGVKGKGPHSLRHLFAILSLENGNDLHNVSSDLGHRDITTTQRYLRYTHKQRAERHDKFSPINNL